MIKLNNKIELELCSTEEYLDARFEAFLEKEGIQKDNLTETALNVFRRGYGIVFITTLPKEEVEL